MRQKVVRVSVTVRIVTHVEVLEQAILHLERWLVGLGGGAPAAYVLICIVAAVLLVPGSFLKAMAGVLFGTAWGTLYAFLGTYFGALAAFGVARAGPRRPIERRMAGYPRIEAFDRSLAEDGRKLVLLLRMSPLVPYATLNYALGLTRVRFVDYAVASPAMLPTVFVYVYAGAAARRAVGALAGRSEMTPIEWTVLGVGLVATALVTWLVGHKARVALRATPGGAPG